jgi:capsular exopolysaccharide synthesis family protein
MRTEVHDKSNEDYTIDLAKLARQLLTPRRIIIMLLAGFICALAAFAYSKFCLTDLYTTSLSMYVNSNERGYQNDTVDAVNLTVSRNLVDSYVVVLSNDVVMEEVGAVLLNEYSEETVREYFPIDERNGKEYIKAKYIKGHFKIAPVDETEVLEITVTTPNPQLSADMCNAMADVAPDFLQRVVGAGSVEAIGAAVPPDSKASPNNTANAVKGALVGVVLAIAVFVLKLLLDTKIRDTESFKEKFDYPVMGEIPFIAGVHNKVDKKNDKKDDEKMRGLAVDSFAVVEAFNKMCTNLLITMTMNDEKIVVVSSPVMSDGKSTIALNTARTMSKMNKKVLLIDLDLRRPSIHKKLNTDNKKGFMNLMSKTETMESVIRKDTESELDILLSGGVSPNPSEILASKRFNDIIEHYESEYDIIVIDSPPLNMVTDSCIIAQKGAGILVVLRANESRFEDFKQVADSAEMAQSRIVGVILNGVEEDRKRYGYKYGYRYGYKYGYDYSSDNQK